MTCVRERRALLRPFLCIYLLVALAVVSVGEVPPCQTPSPHTWMGWAENQEDDKGDGE